jgi:DnaK suppressor protein
MRPNLEQPRQTLESQLRESGPTRGLRESIRIHQVADPVDLTQQAADRAVAVHNLDRDSALVRSLRGALARIDDGSYGLCLECEGEIAPQRLKAIPWAELCIQCQENADRLTPHSEDQEAA